MGNEFVHHAFFGSLNRVHIPQLTVYEMWDVGRTYLPVKDNTISHRVIQFLLDSDIITCESGIEADTRMHFHRRNNGEYVSELSCRGLSSETDYHAELIDFEVVIRDGGTIHVSRLPTHSTY